MLNEPLTLFIDARAVQQLAIHHDRLLITPTRGSTLIRPLRWVRYMLVSGQPTAGMTALLGCAEVGIRVGFFSCRGRLRAMLLPPWRESDGLERYLQDMAPDTPEYRHLSDWLDEHRRQAYTRLGLPAKSVAQQELLFTERMSCWLKQQSISASHWRTAREWLCGVQQFYIRAVLQEYGVDYQSRIGNLLANALLQIVMPCLLLQLSRIELPDNASPGEAPFQHQLNRLSAETQFELRRLLNHLQWQLERGIFYDHTGTLYH